MTKTCRGCDKDKSLECFSKQRLGFLGYRSRCKDCISRERLEGPPERIAQTTKVCSRCNACKSVDEFAARRDRTKRGAGLVAWCRPCYAEYAKEKRQLNPGKYRNVQRAATLKKLYGISKDQYDAMLAAQGGCAICGTTAPNGNGSFHVDHDHVTGKVRGLLCSKCNLGLGLLGDEPVSAANRLLEYASYSSGRVEETVDEYW